MNKWSLALGAVRSLVLKRPFYIAYRVTRRCPLSCSFCTVRRSPKDAGDELALDRIQTMVQTLKLLNPPYVLLTGGDPLVRKDFIDIVGLFRDAGIDTRIQTNGPLLNQGKIAALNELGMRDFAFSLDHVDPAVNDAVRGRNAHHNTIEAIERLRKQLPEAMIIVNCVITPSNIDTVAELVQLINRYGAWATFSPVHYSDQEKVQGQSITAKVKASEATLSLTNLEPARIENCFNTLLKARKSGARILNSSVYLKQCRDSLIAKNNAWNCDAGTLYLEIGPNGSVAPCSQLPEALSVFQPDFITQLTGTTYRRQSQTRARACSGCSFSCYREVSAMRDPRVQIQRALLRPAG